MINKVYILTILLLSFTVNCLSQDMDSIQEVSNDIPPPPPKPRIIIDQEHNDLFKKNGLELLEIRTYHCGSRSSNEKIYEAIKGDTLIVSVNVESNCCKEFLGRISNNWGEEIIIELYRFGYEICTCNCSYSFDFIILIKNEELWNVERKAVIDYNEYKINGG